MKTKTLILTTMVTAFFVSCKKDRVCTCTFSTVDEGTEYYIQNTNQGSRPYNSSSPTLTTETKYNRISKKYGNEVCPSNDVSHLYHDDTQVYSITYNVIDGKRGTYTTTKACKLK